jgi:hypothetical protein
MASAHQFADQVVRVIRQRSDGTRAPAGFGLVVGERAGTVYITTPSLPLPCCVNVAWGLDRPSSLGATPGVVFWGDRYKHDSGPPAGCGQRAARSGNPRGPSTGGLAVLRAPMVPAAQLQRGTWVWNIGIGQDWDMPDRAGGVGTLDVVSNKLHVGGLCTPLGASGGVGVTDTGVIGIVLQDGSDYSVLLPVERIVQHSLGPSGEPTDMTSPRRPRC